MRLAKVVMLPALIGFGVVLLGGGSACSDDAAEPKRGRDDGTSGSGSSGGASSSGSSSGQSSSSSGGPTDAAGPGDDGGLGATYRAFDVNFILSTGQSLSIGAQGAPALSTAQPDQNVMFDTGVIAGGTNLTSFVPLVEANVETMSAGLANHISGDAKTSFGIEHDILLGVHGVGGFSYAQLQKGQPPYANGLAQAKAGFDLAKAAGKSLVVRAVTTVHGETDHVQANPNYQANIAQWQAAYETDVKAITGQTEPIPMLHTQMHRWTKLPLAEGGAISDVSRIPLDQLAVHIASGGKTVLVGPKYHLPYAPDGVHLTNEGYRHMGEDYAKAYRQIVLRGKKWEPLRPISVKRDGATITVQFLVPAPPLKIDDELVTNPADYGFELSGDDEMPNITSVDVTAADTVTIKLAAAPTGANKRLRYAFTGTPKANAGPTTGPRGNLRDSDNTKSLYGFELYNWCVTFDEALP
jgi:hypothetical protein